jgi:hypothetical protein
MVRRVGESVLRDGTGELIGAGALLKYDDTYERVIERAWREKGCQLPATGTDMGLIKHCILRTCETPHLYPFPYSHHYKRPSYVTESS